MKMNTRRHGVLACFALIGTFGLVGCGGGDDSSPPATGKKTSGDTSADTTPSTSTARLPSGGGGLPGTSGQTDQPAGPVRVATAHQPNFGARKDPFKIDWKPLPPPPNVFEEVQPQRIASLDVPTPIERPVTVREISPYRVSGVMTGDGVFAILEGVGQPEVVKPGSKLPNGYTVIAINEDSVRLEKKDGKITYVQTVPLSDGPSNAPGNGGGGNVPGGGAPGGKGLPGTRSGVGAGGNRGGRGGGASPGD